MSENDIFDELAKPIKEMADEDFIFIILLHGIQLLKN